MERHVTILTIADAHPASVLWQGLHYAAENEIGDHLVILDRIGQLPLDDLFDERSCDKDHERPVEVGGDPQVESFPKVLEYVHER